MYWTSKEIGLLKAGYAAGKSVATIAAELGRHPSTVAWQASKFGMSPKRIQWTAKEDKLLAKHGNLTAAGIAKLLPGRTNGAVLNRIHYLKKQSK